jgi:hypothetical protein
MPLSPEHMHYSVMREPVRRAQHKVEGHARNTVELMRSYAGENPYDLVWNLGQLRTTSRDTAPAVDRWLSDLQSRGRPGFGRGPAHDALVGALEGMQATNPSLQAVSWPLPGERPVTPEEHAAIIPPARQATAAAQQLLRAILQRQATRRRCNSTCRRRDARVMIGDPT